MESGRLFFGCNSTTNNMLFLGHGDNYFRGTSTMRSVLNMEEASKRRPFCNLMDDVLEEEYYDEQSPEKKRRLTPEQVHMLEKSFEEENKLEPERKTELAKKLGLQPRQVAVWFQNRRARWKTKQLERDYDRLKSSYDALVSDYDSIVKENDVLKAEVVSLTEKMQSKEVAKTAVISTEPPREEYSGNAMPSIPLGSIKVEDHLSTGSGGSAVVDDHDQDGPQLVDSGDSYLPDDHGYPDQYVAVGIDQSEEDDGSDDGRSYFSHVFAAAEHINHNEEEEPMGWCVWPEDV